MTRMFVVLGVLIILPGAIVVQIFRIQFMEGENLRALWSAQAVDFIPIPAERGNIVDSKGRILVTNTITYSVAVDPRAPGAQQEKIRLVTDILGHFDPRGSNHFQRVIRQAPRESRYIVLGRGYGRQVYDSLQTHNIRGLILEENYRRRYNFNEMASHIVGHVNRDFNGVMGLEAYYDRFLRGEPGVQQVRKDSRNRIKEFVGAPRKKPIQGHTLHTTIDAQIQAIVEEELREGIGRARAKSGTAIVVDPRTGAIVAMANYPDFNPNRPGDAETASRRNPAIADMIEPGSTFKLVTAIAAMDQRVVELDEVFETPETGRKLIHGQWMRDHDPLGTLSFRQVIERSSNVATAEVAMRIKPETFYQYTRNLGFGTSTSIDLPGEESGRLRKPYEWSLVSLPWMSVGYELQVTPLQMVMAYAAFANDGKLMRPYIVDRVTDDRGRTITRNRPKKLRQAIPPKVVQALKPVFEGVVSDSGTARVATIDGLRIAGKTGTAQKFIDGRYQPRYRASFVGFFPVEQPKYVTLVLLDEPRTSIYGGAMAGPIFRNITSRIIGLDPELQQFIRKDKDDDTDAHFAHIPSLKKLSLDEAATLLKFLNYRFTVEGRGDLVLNQEPAAGSLVEPGTTIRLITHQAGIEDDETDPQNRIPDVRGLSMRQAVLALRKAGYEVSRNGSGTVHAQFPEPGAVMQPGRTVTIRGRARSMEQLLSERSGR